MARKKNRGGGGCLIWFIAIFGNLFLFSGALFGDLSDNSIAWTFAIIAVIIDIVFIRSLMPPASKTQEQSATVKKTVTKSQPANTTSKDTAQPVVPNQSGNSKLEALKEKYSVPSIPAIPSTIDPLQKDMESYQALEILQAVNSVVNLRMDLCKQLVEKKKELDELLSCPDCSTDREKIKYLNAHEKALGLKKKEYNDTINVIMNKKVILLSKEELAFAQLKNIFYEIATSQKIIGNAGVAYNSFIKRDATIPGDLFESTQKPIELDFGVYRFFLLPDVVLAFNKNGEFISAFEPFAMIISLEERRKNVYASRRNYGNWTFRDDLIASDSTLVSNGHVRTSWLHEKKSGGPDMRYSHANNPRYDSRTDIYAYSEFSIQIGHYKAVYSVSKGALTEKTKPIIRKYCSISHKLNTMPSLLRLLASTAKNKKNALDLYGEYIQVSKDIICRES
ncbi:MAG: hypothetical protein Q4D81_07455 [Eubacteriales bacterium]|nr:hypothetical protein [Eubacteriales bacterium]